MTTVPSTPRLEDWSVELVDLTTGVAYLIWDEIIDLAFKVEPGATRHKLIDGTLEASPGTYSDPSWCAQSLNWAGWQAVKFVPYGDTSKEFWALVVKTKQSYGRRKGRIPLRLIPIGHLLHSRLIYDGVAPISGANLTVDDYAKKLVRYTALSGTVQNDAEGNSRVWGWGTLAVAADTSASAVTMAATHSGHDEHMQYLDDVLNALAGLDPEFYWELLPSVAGGATTFTFQTAIDPGTDRSQNDANRWVISDFADAEPTGERTVDKIGMINAMHSPQATSVRTNAGSIATYGRWEGKSDARDDDNLDMDLDPSLPQVGTKIGYNLAHEWMDDWDVGDIVLTRNLRLGVAEDSERIAEVHARFENKILRIDLIMGEREIEYTKKNRGGRGGKKSLREVLYPEYATPVSVGGANAEGNGYYLVRDDHVHKLTISIPIPATVSPSAGDFSFESADNSVVYTTPGAGRVDLSATGPGTYHDLLNGTEHPDTANATVQTGDIIRGDATPRWQRYGIGSEDQVLTVSSGLPVWENRLWTRGANVGGAGVAGLYPTTTTDVVSIGAAAYADSPRNDTMLQVHGSIAVDRYVHAPATSLVLYGVQGGQAKVHIGEAGLGNAWLDVYYNSGETVFRADAGQPEVWVAGAPFKARAADYTEEFIIDGSAVPANLWAIAGATTTWEGKTYQMPTDAPANGEALLIKAAGATNTLEWGNPAPAAHDVLSTSHGDTVASAVSRGSIIYGNATPKWAELAAPGSASVLAHDTTDVSWSTAPTVDTLYLHDANHLIQHSINNVRILTATGAQIRFDDGAGTILTIMSDRFEPGGDGAIDLGRANHQFKRGYFDSNVYTGGDLYFETLKGIIHADSVADGKYLRANGFRYVPNDIQAGDIPDISGTYVTDVIGGTAITDVGGPGGDITLNLDDTAVVPGAYGDATHVGQFTVDQQGRLTAAADVLITGVTPSAHDIVGALHTVAGAAMDVIGLDGVNSLAVLTPSSDPGASSKILKSTDNGYLELVQLRIASVNDYLFIDTGYFVMRGQTGVGLRSAAATVYWDAPDFRPAVDDYAHLGDADGPVRWKKLWVYDVDAAATVQAEHLYSTDDLQVDDDADIGGALAVTGAITGASVTVTGTVKGSHLWSTNTAQIDGVLTVNANVVGLLASGDTDDTAPGISGDTSDWEAGGSEGNRGAISVKDSGGTARYIYIADDAVGTNARWELMYMPMTTHWHQLSGDVTGGAHTATAAVAAHGHDSSTITVQ